MAQGNLLIVQGGGATPVLNASLTAVVAEAQAQPGLGRILGSRFGMQGLSQADTVELTPLSGAELSAIRNSPGAALGSSRFAPSEADLERCLAHLRAQEVRSMLFMGGNGTMRGAGLFLEYCQAAGYALQVIGVPKTIDNDIAATDRCPGFGSAGRFVAQSMLDLSADVRSLPQPVSIFETLGRDVGWIAACSSLAKAAPDDPPHLVLLPEVPFVQEHFLASVENTVRRLGWALVVVSEGTAYGDGTPVFEQQVTSRAGVKGRPLIGGVAQYLSGLVGYELGIRCRSEKPGLIGRSSIAQVAGQDLHDAELVGREAVRALLAGHSGVMVSLRPLGAEPACTLVPLHEAGGPRRALPPKWLSGDELGVNEAFRAYARPLVGKLAHPAHLLAQ